ncbi:MAG: aminopeptidase N [Kangiella sp.]|nr:MAG: aminopeptidase N [Kangiella sp.]
MLEVKTKYRKDYRVSQFLIKQTRLDFQLYDDHVIVVSELSLYRNTKDQQEQLQPLELNGVEIELLELHIDGEKINADEYHAHAKGLSIYKVSDNFILKAKVKIFPQKNTSLEGLYTSNQKFCSQCESEGFRKITYYLDRPDVMSEFFVRVEADKEQYPLLLSNGNPTKNGTLDNGRHFVDWHDPFPKPSYLFALVAGDLDCLEDNFITCSGRNILLQIFVDKGKLDQCDFAMQSLINAMKWDEEKFGREYDLDRYMIVAVGDFNMGAMENKGLNIFNTAYVLANKKTATDRDFEGVECVIAHEYFHNWTGNRITCRDWFQLSLKEGLTVYRDQRFSEDMQSQAVQRIEQVKIIRSAQFAEDSGPMAHAIRPDSYIEMNNFYTVTVYNKGAEVIRMMNTLLGEEGFRKGMDHYFETHDGNAVTCEDFIVSMETANDVDWTLFRNWYRQAGTPTVSMKLDKLHDKHIRLSFNQSCSTTLSTTSGQVKKEPFMIPVTIGFVDQDGKPAQFKQKDDNELQSQALLVLTESNQVFDFELQKNNVIPSVFRNFSAPIIFDFKYSQKQLGILFANDPDPFNRWDAGQKLMTSILNSKAEEVSTDELKLLVNSFKNILSDQSLDHSLKALALQLPDQNTLIANSISINLDRLFNKTKQLKSYIAKSLDEEWLRTYTSLNNELQNSLNENKGDSGKRWLKNIALNYLLISNESKYFELARKQQNSANNMTDEISALQLIAKTNQPSKAIQVDHFYDKWSNEELVLDKWFSAQVMVDNDDAVNQVKELFQHDKFSIKNPNKVRAVLGCFIANNLTQFHNSNGSGYEFCGDMIIQLNNINPQIGARLTKQFSVWKKLDGKRQALIKEQLGRILQVENLSKDIFEVADKSLTH